MNEAPWRPTLDGVVIRCRLTPKGGRDAIEGAATLADGQRMWLARVRAAPENGKANDALCALIAERLDVTGSRVTLAAGAKSRIKQIAVSGDRDELVKRLQALEARES